MFEEWGNVKQVKIFYLLLLISWSAVLEPAPLILLSLFDLFTSPLWQMGIIVEQLVESMLRKGNRSTRGKSAPVLLCPPQFLYEIIILLNVQLTYEK
jgi:hypothetical protein